MLLSHTQTNSRRAWSLPRVRLKVRQVRSVEIERRSLVDWIRMAERSRKPKYDFKNLDSRPLVRSRLSNRCRKRAERLLRPHGGFGRAKGHSPGGSDDQIGQAEFDVSVGGELRSLARPCRVPAGTTDTSKPLPEGV